jgi:hypothetical protein
MKCSMPKASTTMVPGSAICVEYSGFNGLKITTGNARIRSEERPGGPGYVKIPGWLFEKAAGF